MTSRSGANVTDRKRSPPDQRTLSMTTGGTCWSRMAKTAARPAMVGAPSIRRRTGHSEWGYGQTAYQRLPTYFCALGMSAFDPLRTFLGRAIIPVVSSDFISATLLVISMIVGDAFLIETLTDRETYQRTKYPRVYLLWFGLGVSTFGAFTHPSNDNAVSLTGLALVFLTMFLGVLMALGVIKTRSPE